MNDLSHYYESYLNNVFENQKQAITDQLTAEIRDNVRGDILEVIQHSQRLERCNVFLMYVHTTNEHFPLYYGMYVLDNERQFDSPEAPIYCNRNALCKMSYTIEDVKKEAKKYLTMIIEQL